MWLPSGTDCWTTTEAPSPSESVSSTMTMASAPGGMGAPVMIRAASPGPTGLSRPDIPAATVPTTFRVTGASATSAARTANPSMAVLAKGGTDSPATASAAVTRPRQPANGRETAGSGSHPDRTTARASANEIIGGACRTMSMRKSRNSGPRSSRSTAISTVARR